MKTLIYLITGITLIALSIPSYGQTQSPIPNSDQKFISFNHTLDTCHFDAICSLDIAPKDTNPLNKDITPSMVDNQKEQPTVPTNVHHHLHHHFFYRIPEEKAVKIDLPKEIIPTEFTDGFKIPLQK